jgi:hypothetical protein
MCWLSKTIMEAAAQGLALHDAHVVGLENKIINLLSGSSEGECAARLWLVVDEHSGVCGVWPPL